MSNTDFLQLIFDSWNSAINKSIFSQCAKNQKAQLIHSVGRTRTWLTNTHTQLFDGNASLNGVDWTVRVNMQNCAINGRNATRLKAEKLRLQLRASFHADHVRSPSVIGYWDCYDTVVRLAKFVCFARSVDYSILSSAQLSVLNSRLWKILRVWVWASECVMRILTQISDRRWVCFSSMKKNFEFYMEISFTPVNCSLPPPHPPISTPRAFFLTHNRRKGFSTSADVGRSIHIHFNSLVSSMLIILINKRVWWDGKLKCFPHMWETRRHVKERQTTLTKSQRSQTTTFTPTIWIWIFSWQVTSWQFQFRNPSISRRSLRRRGEMWQITDVTC